MRTTLINHILKLSRAIESVGLPDTYDQRGFFTAAQMALIIGRPPRWTDGTALQLMRWTRSVRKINGITQRVWFPPTESQI
jgi:hypothetical protein